MQRKPQKNAARVKRRKKWRVMWNGLKHDMDPGIIGLTAAEFWPADPAAWIEAAVAARLEFVRHGDRIIFNPAADNDDAHCEFLKGLLIGTQGGPEALVAYMEARRIRGIVEDRLIEG